MQTANIGTAPAQNLDESTGQAQNVLEDLGHTSQDLSRHSSQDTDGPHERRSSSAYNR
jgi:hypothetical protein